MTTTEPEVQCEVCRQEPSVGVAAIPGLPMSVAYGYQCLKANAHPYGAMVAMTAMADGYDSLATWAQEMIEATLLRLNKSNDEFEQHVREMIRDLHEFEVEGDGL